MPKSRKRNSQRTNLRQLPPQRRRRGSASQRNSSPYYNRLIPGDINGPAHKVISLPDGNIGLAIKAIGRNRPDQRLFTKPNRFLAVDAKSVGGALVDHENNQKFYYDIIDVQSSPAEFAKQGAAVWETLGIDVPLEYTAGLLSLQRIDKPTADAAHAAILNAVNTTLNSVDVGLIVLALASFVNSHPTFRAFVEPETHEKPYGEDTRYCVLPEY